MGARLSTWLTLAGLAVAFALGGCASSTTTARSNQEPEHPAAALRRGMSPAQVELIMGKPDEVRHVANQGSTIDIWLYRRAIGSRVEGIAPTVVEVPWVDPVTGELKLLREPLNSEQRIDFVEELSVYLASGQLADVRRTVMRERSFSQ